MSNIIKFPKEIEQPAAPAPVEPAAAPAAPNKAPGAGLLAGLVKFVWVATVLVWPILKWVLSTLILFIALAVVDGALFAPMMGFEAFSEDAGQPLSFLASLALLLPNLAVSVRRLHDTDRSGWWLLLAIIPIIGSLVLLFFMIQRGTDGANRFG